DNSHILRVTQSGAAVFGWNKDTKESKLTEIFKNVERERLIFVPFHDMRANFFFGEFAYDAFYFEQFFTEGEIHMKCCARSEGRFDHCPRHVAIAAPISGPGFLYCIDTNER